MSAKRAELKVVARARRCCAEADDALASPTPRRLPNDERGFTLLELLVAITLMAIGIFAVLGMQSVAMRANSLANQLSVAAALAQQVQEDLLSQSGSDAIFATSSANNVYSRFPDPNNPSQLTQNTISFSSGAASNAGAGTYSATYSITVGTGANGIPSGLSRVVVTVTGVAGTAAEGRNVTMTCLKRTV